MKKISLLIAALGLGATAFAQVGPVPGCPGAFGATKIITGQLRNDTSSTIAVNTTWDKDTIYILKKIVRVGSGANLTIQAGTVIMGFPNDTSTLHIMRGSRIVAIGTPTAPIVMTSCKIQGSRKSGDWGGLVICGRATQNQPTPLQLEGNYGAFYGGTNDDDNSGNLSYVRVEYPGFAFEANREINGITFGAVGAGTVTQFVQVTSSNDDSFEWFGGTNSARNIIAWKGLDDDFDTDFGYRGFVQFGLGYRDYEIADFSGSNAFESDNDAAGSTATPKTAPIFSNMEVWGPVLTAEAPFNPFYKTAAMLRRNTETDIYNSLMFGWAGDTTVTDGQGAQVSGVYINGQFAANNAAAGLIRFKKNTVAAYNAYPTTPAYDNVGTFNAVTWFNTGAFANTFTNGLFSFITQKKAPLKEVPLFALNVGAALASGSSFTTAGMNTDLPTGFIFAPMATRGFQSVAYRGAHAGTEWAAAWSEYNPNIFKYVAGGPTTRKGQVEAFLAAGEEAATNGIYCQPNPAQGQTTVKFLFDSESAEAAVSILDMAGNLVSAQSATAFAGANELPINVSTLNPGMYIVRVSANGTVAKTTKLNVVR